MWGRKEDGVDGRGMVVGGVGGGECVKGPEKGVGKVAMGGEGRACVALCGGCKRGGGNVEVCATQNSIAGVMTVAGKGGDGGGVGFGDGAASGVMW